MRIPVFISHQQLKKTKKKKNAEFGAETESLDKKIRTKSRSCTEMSSDWRIAQCMDIECILGYHFLLFSVLCSRF